MPSFEGALVLSLLAGAAANQGDHFGPGNCVSVAKSTAGTCLLTTDCEGKDTSNFEFAFDCRLPAGGAVERHSFGLGGFDAQEEYDTEVQCDMCTMPGNMPKLPPANVQKRAPVPVPNVLKPLQQKDVQQAMQNPILPMHHAVLPKPGVLTVPGRWGGFSADAVVKNAGSTRHVKGTHAWVKTAHHPEAPLTPVTHFMAHKGMKQTVRAKTEAIAQTESAAQDDDQTWATPPPKDKGAEAPVKFGPKSCVSTWRSDDGHCIVQTDCGDAPIEDYEFGLVCVDTVGKPVRHLFGKGSFDPVETFDTLIKCKQCLGLEDVPDELMLNNEVLGLAGEVKELQGMMTDMTGNIKKLNEKVFAAAPAPAAAVPQSPAAAVALKAEAQGTAHHHRGKKHHKAHQKHHLRKQSHTKLSVQHEDEVQEAQEQQSMDQSTEQQSSEEEQATVEQTADQQDGEQQDSAEATEQDSAEATEQAADTQSVEAQTEQEADEQQTDEQHVEQGSDEQQADEQQAEPAAYEGQADGEEVGQAEAGQGDSETEETPDNAD